MFPIFELKKDEPSAVATRPQRAHLVFFRFAISGAPIKIGTNQLPKPPIKAGITSRVEAHKQNTMYSAYYKPPPRNRTCSFHRIRLARKIYHSIPRQVKAGYLALMLSGQHTSLLSLMDFPLVRSPTVPSNTKCWKHTPRRPPLGALLVLRITPFRRRRCL